MNNALIHTTAVTLSSALDAVEVTAHLVSGAVRAGMFLRIPLNGSLDITLLIEQVSNDTNGGLHLVLGCDRDAEAADFILALNFADEILRVTQNGEI